MTFRKNGYSEKFITSATRTRTRQEAQKAEETLTEASNSRRKTLCVIPYVKGDFRQVG